MFAPVFPDLDPPGLFSERLSIDDRTAVTTSFVFVSFLNESSEIMALIGEQDHRNETISYRSRLMKEFIRKAKNDIRILLQNSKLSNDEVIQDIDTKWKYLEKLRDGDLGAWSIINQLV